MRRSALLALVVTAALAFASQGMAGSKTPPAPNPTVLMSPVALPIVVDGRLVNYVFVTIRLGLSSKADAIKLRAMEPYFRDALVKVAYRTPFVRDDDYTALDDVKLKAALLREANRLAGAGMLVSAKIVREQAMHYDGLPKPRRGSSAPDDPPPVP